MTLGKYFTLEEMCRTSHTQYQAANNKPGEVIIQNLTSLVQNILDPLREDLGPLKITSGYRCPALNKSIGGAPTSQHQFGQAADVQGIAFSNAEVFEKIQELQLPFDQLIWEYGDTKEPDWVHVSFGPRARRQVLYIR